MAGAGAVVITATAAAMDTAGVATAIGEAGTSPAALAVDVAEALDTADLAVGTAEADGAKIRSASSSPFQPNWVEGALFLRRDSDVARTRSSTHVPGPGMPPSAPTKHKAFHSSGVIVVLRDAHPQSSGPGLRVHAPGLYSYRPTPGDSV